VKSLTYREKSLYWNLVPNALIFVVLVATMLFTTFDPLRHPGAVFACVTLYYLGSVGDLIYTMYFARDTRTDERDRTLELRATRSGYAALSGGIFVLIYMAAVYGFDRSPRFVLWLFAVWILSRVVRDASELRLHAGHEGLWPDALIERQRRRMRNRMENPTPRQREVAARFVERERRKGRL